MTDPQDDLTNELIAELPLSPRGRMVQHKIASNRLRTKHAQQLSEIEPDDPRVLPHNYRNHYEWLKQHKPREAIEFWEKWAYDPRPKPKDKHELARTMLERQGRDNTLKRRV